MRIYIASAFDNREAVNALSRELHERGHFVLSSWHVVQAAASRESEPKLDDTTKIRLARQCQDEIDASDAVIAIGHPAMRGALWECGYAHGRRKPVWWVGSRDVSLFATLAFEWPG